MVCNQSLEIQKTKLAMLEENKFTKQTLLKFNQHGHWVTLSANIHAVINKGPVLRYVILVQSML